MPHIAKRTKAARQGIDRETLYPLDEAVKLVKERATAKFDETVEVAINLGVDPRHADQMVRGVCQLPNGSGRSVRVAVFARGDKAEQAKAAGADIVGAEDLVEKVQGGTIDFDRCIATPDMMPLVGRLGKGFGPPRAVRLSSGSRRRGLSRRASARRASRRRLSSPTSRRSPTPCRRRG